MVFPAEKSSRAEGHEKVIVTNSDYYAKVITYRTVGYPFPQDSSTVLSSTATENDSDLWYTCIKQQAQTFKPVSAAGIGGGKACNSVNPILV